MWDTAPGSKHNVCAKRQPMGHRLCWVAHKMARPDVPKMGWQHAIVLPVCFGSKVRCWCAGMTILA